MPAGGYTPIGKGTIVVAPAVAAIATPTRAEITAGTAVIATFRELTGFTTEQNRIEQPDYVNAFTPTIPGRQAAGAAQITFYARDLATDAIRNAFPEGTDKFIMLFPQGDVPTMHMSVWPARIGSVNESDWASDPGAGHLFIVNLAITSAPAKYAVIPA